MNEQFDVCSLKSKLDLLEENIRKTREFALAMSDHNPPSKGFLAWIRGEQREIATQWASITNSKQWENKKSPSLNLIDRNSQIPKAVFEELDGRLKALKAAFQEISDCIDTWEEKTSGWLSGWKYRDEKWSKIDKTNSDIKAGFIYILKNGALPDVYKIGFSTRNPHTRAKEIQARYNTSNPFEVVYFKECQFPYLVEQRAFDKLQLKVDCAELVKEELPKLVELIDQCIKDVEGSVVDGEVQGLTPVFGANIITREPKQRFSVGDWVVHSTLGEGWVQAKRGGPRPQYTIFFKEGAVREVIDFDDAMVDKLEIDEKNPRPARPDWWLRMKEKGKKDHTCPITGLVFLCGLKVSEKCFLALMGPTSTTQIADVKPVTPKKGSADDF